jgi:hypothetical protein
MHAARALTLIILSCEMSLHCQTPSPPVDIYAGFVGTWIGTGDYPIKDGVRIKQDVELECSETTKKDALKCQYAFGHKGDKNFRRAIHTITLDPIKGIYTSVWGGGWWGADYDQTYQTVGLDTFAKRGKGVFMASAFGTKGTPRAVMNIAFGLDEHTFVYRWDTSSDGKTFVNFSTFSFTRAASNPTGQH